METKEFISLLTEGKCNKAKELIGRLYKNNSPKYGASLVMVIMVKANRLLQHMYSGYYISEEYVEENTDKENVYSLIDEMCSAVKESTGQNREKIFQKALSYINANLEDASLYPGSVAEFVGIGQSDLSKLFQQKIEMTPLLYITKNRVEKSKLLLDENYSVGEVAKLCGFSCAEVYIRAFKRIYGMTPGKHREMR